MSGTRIKVGDWVIYKKQKENPHAYSCVACLVIAETESGEFQLRNSFSEESELAKEEELFKVEGIPFNLKEMKVLEAISEIRDLGVAETAKRYIDELRDKLGLPQLDFPWVNLREL